MGSSFYAKGNQMSRPLLGVLLGIFFGVVDMTMTIWGKHPDMTAEMLAQAFFSRFALGFLGANVSLGVNPILSGALVGFLVSLPDAFGLKSYAGIIGSGLVFGALTGWATKLWGK